VREGKNCADALAQRGVKPEQLVAFEEPPEEIGNKLIEDILPIGNCATTFRKLVFFWYQRNLTKILKKREIRKCMKFLITRTSNFSDSDPSASIYHFKVLPFRPKFRIFRSDRPFFDLCQPLFD